jgi:hypothetical protein
MLRSKAWVRDRSIVGIAGSNPVGCTDVCLCVTCCHVEMSAVGRSLVQMSPTECGESECDRGNSQRKSRRTTAV